MNVPYPFWGDVAPQKLSKTPAYNGYIYGIQFGITKKMKTLNTKNKNTRNGFPRARKTLNTQLRLKNHGKSFLESPNSNNKNKTSKF